MHACKYALLLTRQIFTDKLELDPEKEKSNSLGWYMKSVYSNVMG